VGYLLTSPLFTLHCTLFFIKIVIPKMVGIPSSYREEQASDTGLEPRCPGWSWRFISPSNKIPCKYKGKVIPVTCCRDL
jgi:hypothetical protein